MTMEDENPHWESYCELDPPSRFTHSLLVQETTPNAPKNPNVRNQAALSFRWKLLPTTLEANMNPPALDLKSESGLEKTREDREVPTSG